MEIIFDKNIEQLNGQVLSLFSQKVYEILEKKEFLTFGICGGRSVGAIFALLKNATDLPWNRIHIFMVDERVKPITDSESNYKFAYDLFLEYLVNTEKIPQENLHPWIIDEKQDDFGISHYQKEFDSINGKFDLVFLGIGEDGHLAGLFPGHETIKNETQSFFVYDSSPKPPNLRMSASKKMLLTTEVSFVFFVGQKKMDAYNNFFNKQISLEYCPAKIFYDFEGVYVITDLNDKS